MKKTATENSMADFCACLLYPALFAVVHNLGCDLFVFKNGGFSSLLSIAFKADCKWKHWEMKEEKYQQA